MKEDPDDGVVLKSDDEHTVDGRRTYSLRLHMTSHPYRAEFDKNTGAPCDSTHVRTGDERGGGAEVSARVSQQVPPPPHSALRYFIPTNTKPKPPPSPPDNRRPNKLCPPVPPLSLSPPLFRTCQVFQPSSSFNPSATLHVHPVVMVCGNCGGEGHNRRTCTNRVGALVAQEDALTTRRPRRTMGTGTSRATGRSWGSTTRGGNSSRTLLF